MSLGQDPLEAALNLVSSRDYTVSRNDSPASIARKFGVSMDQLLNANPQKATTYVKGVRTWTDLSINEGLNMPKAGVRLGYVAGVGQALDPGAAVPVPVQVTPTPAVVQKHHGLSTGAVIGIAAVSAVVVGGVVYAVTR